MNVEHMQVLVFFFHCLPLMQKKRFLLELAQHVETICASFHVQLPSPSAAATVGDNTSADSMTSCFSATPAVSTSGVEGVVDDGSGQTVLQRVVPLGVARMLLLLDYFLHYFYDPPATLIEQVRSG